MLILIRCWQKNWAGPEHWRLRRLIKDNQPKTAEPVSRKKKEKKEFLFDFLNAETIDPKKLFAKGTPATINLGKEKKTVNANRCNLLPCDLHFSSVELTKLFTKPLCTIKFRKASQQTASSSQEIEMESDWTQADGYEPASQALETTVNTTMNASVFDDDDYEMPDNSYFVGSTAETGTDIGSELVARPKFIKKIEINFAKAAKKVDVKKLKENIWKKLTVDENNPSKAEVVSGKKEFSKVINTLNAVYPEKKMKDISVPFCFICLLHLANEKNLSLQGSSGLNELIITQNH